MRKVSGSKDTPAVITVRVWRVFGGEWPWHYRTVYTHQDGKAATKTDMYKFRRIATYMAHRAVKKFQREHKRQYGDAIRVDVFFEDEDGMNAIAPKDLNHTVRALRRIEKDLSR